MVIIWGGLFQPRQYVAVQEIKSLLTYYLTSGFGQAGISHDPGPPIPQALECVADLPHWKQELCWMSSYLQNLEGVLTVFTQPTYWLIDAINTILL